MRDSKILRKHTETLQKFIDTLPKELNQYQIEMLVKKNYPTLYNDYPFIVKAMARRQDMTMLETMLKQIETIQSGQKTKEEVEDKLGKELFNKFVKDKI